MWTDGSSKHIWRFHSAAKVGFPQPLCRWRFFTDQPRPHVCYFSGIFAPSLSRPNKWTSVNTTQVLDQEPHSGDKWPDTRQEHSESVMTCFSLALWHQLVKIWRKVRKKRPGRARKYKSNPSWPVTPPHTAILHVSTLKESLNFFFQPETLFVCGQKAQIQKNMRF